jgi:hypothetical protein
VVLVNYTTDQIIECPYLFKCFNIETVFALFFDLFIEMKLFQFLRWKFSYCVYELYYVLHKF